MLTKQQIIATLFINQLLNAGYKLDKLPTPFTTNDGWVIDYTDADVPGKVGLVMNKGTMYALIVGDLVNDVFINTEVEAYNGEVLEKFYNQLGIFCGRVLAYAEPHADEPVRSKEEARAVHNWVLEAAFAQCGIVEAERQIKIGEHWYYAEVSRKPKGNGVITVHGREGYYYIQFVNGKVQSFNTRKFIRGAVVQNITDVINHVLEFAHA